MANRAAMLDAELARGQARRERIQAAAQRRPRLPRQEEKWWPYLRELFGTDGDIFRRTRIDRRLFDEVLSFVSNVPLETRGRIGSIRTHREMLLFLLIFMAHGVKSLEILVAKFIKKREQVHKLTKRIAKKFKANIVDGFVRFGNEELPDVPQAALIVDCTVCQVRRPKQPFSEAKVFFSGKHYIYALKKEVFVNIRSGTAAFVSKAFPGSAHDMRVFRSHVENVQNVIGQRQVLADLGYVGARRDLPGIVVCGPDDTELRARRVLVERFFGRLKCLWGIFSETWTIEERYFDRFFDIACGLTNIDILNRPLNAADEEFNEGVRNAILDEIALRLEKQKLANEQYLQRRRERLQYDTSDSSTEEYEYGLDN